MVAVINNFGGYFKTWVYVNELKRQGGIVHLPCVNRSKIKTSITGKDVFLGFVHLQNLEKDLTERIIEERERGGEYRDIPDFLNRIPAGTEQMVILIRIGAFRFTGKTKKELLWEAHLLSGRHTVKENNGKLFPVRTKKFTLPELEQSADEDAYDEMELLGFQASFSPFGLLVTSFRGEIKAREMLAHVGKKVRMVGNLATIKYVRTIKHEWMHFGTFLDVDGEFFDVVNFPASLKKYPYKGKGIYLLLGVITEEMGFPGMTVEKMAKLPFRPDPRY